MNAKDKLQSHFSNVAEQWRGQKDPYVWRLCLSRRFYDDAQSLLHASIAESNGAEFLETEEFAPTAMIMLGEWYKREYSGNNADNPEWVKTVSWERVWQHCGKRHWQRWVYTFEESKRHSWQYSAFVLGGLACRYLSAADKDSRLLKDLCRLFHGQIEEAEIDASQNARAIAMSIERYGSIYHFLLELIDPTSKIYTVYSHDGQEEVRNLRNKIIAANKSVTARKLRAEWIYTTSPYDPENLYRSLKITLGPERVDGEKRWFLSRERAEEWGFDLEKDVQDITVWLCLYKAGVQIDKPRYVLGFQPSGLLSAGFNNVDENHWKLISNLPADFDGWRLIATGGDQRVDIDPQINPVEEYSQIYQTAGNSNNWSSSMRRMASAVLFNDKCRITDPDGHPIAGKLVLVDYAPVLRLNWADIPAYVKLTYPVKGGTREVKLTSPLAQCRVRIDKRFPHLIDYLPDGNIMVRSIVRATGEVVEQTMPFAFGLDNVSLVWLHDGAKPMATEAEVIVARQNGEVCDIDDLHKGIVELTVYAAGMEATTKVWYMPANYSDVPGHRDLQRQIVKWGTKSITTYPATEINRSEELKPTLEIEDGSIFGDKAVFRVFQPVKRSEIWFKGELVNILKDGPIYLPLLHLPDFLVRVFNEDGYRSWCGREHLDDFKGLRLAYPKYTGTGLPQINVINYRKEEPPKNRAVDLGNYVFEKDTAGDNWSVPRYWEQESELDDDPFADEADERAEINPLDALELAIEHNLYSFTFPELTSRKEKIPEMLASLETTRGEGFMQSHKDAIKRILWENDINDYKPTFEL